MNAWPTYSGNIDELLDLSVSFSSVYVNTQKMMERILEMACDAMKCEV